ncbi:MAG: hypothetical protein ACM31C_27270, partial [Acidobacteriota bacterium]
DAAAAPKLAIEKFADGGITCLKFTGTIDEAFDGKKTARTVEGETLVLDLGGVKKISSFGIREWVDFIGSAAKHTKSIVLIECAPKVVDQLNMVANFAGGGKVFSFYAPFRCDYCDSEHRVLLDMAKDFEAIKAMKLAERPCPACKEGMYFDEDGSTYFSYALGQGSFELDPPIAQFLATKLDYRIGTIEAKLRVDKIIEGRVTYLRLGGDLNNSFPRDKLAEGLEGTVIVDVTGVPRVEPAGAAEWRSFVQQIAPLVEQLYLIGVAPAVLEKVCGKDDLGAKAAVVDLTLPYTCGSCGTSSAHSIDVAEHHQVLKFATAPELRCPACKAAMQCAASEALMTILPGLPKPVIGKELAKTIAELRARKLEKKQSTGLAAIPRATGQTEVQRGRGLGMQLLLAAVVVAVAGAGYLAYQRLGAKDTGPNGLGKLVAKSADQRPAWLAGELPPGTQRCATVTGTVICVGASTAVPSQQDAEDEASDAAYEALARELAGRGDKWLDSIAPAIIELREATLAAYSRDPLSTQARRDLHDGQHAVARVIKKLAPQVTARYWEAYESDEGRKHIAYVEVAIDVKELAKLRDRYHRQASALGATVVDYYPELGWRFPKLDHGAVVGKLEHGVLQDLGLAEHQIVLAIDGRDVLDADSFAKVAADEYAVLADKGGTLRLLVQTDTGDPREFSTTIAGKHVEAPPPVNPPSRGGRGGRAPGGSGGVNVWDRFGGSSKAGRDDPTQ